MRCRIHGAANFGQFQRAAQIGPGSAGVDERPDTNSAININGHFGASGGGSALYDGAARDGGEYRRGSRPLYECAAVKRKRQHVASVTRIRRKPARLSHFNSSAHQLPSEARDRADVRFHGMSWWFRLATGGTRAVTAVKKRDQPVACGSVENRPIDSLPCGRGSERRFLLRMRELGHDQAQRMLLLGCAGTADLDALLP